MTCIVDGNHVVRSTQPLCLAIVWSFYRVAFRLFLHVVRLLVSVVVWFASVVIVDATQPLRLPNVWPSHHVVVRLFVHVVRVLVPVVARFSSVVRFAPPAR